jgi:lipoprotein-anchoring transpeptidase ErfK/SrfK
MHQFHFSGSPRPIFSWRPFGGLAILFAAASVINAPMAEARQPAYYGSFFDGWLQTPHQAYRSRRHERAPDRRPVERRPVERDLTEQKGIGGKKPSGPLYAVVSLADQHISFYDANGLWERSVVSTGVAGHPTPPGIFTILEKERWHRSNIYSGAPMPYMQRLAWTGVAMHEGVVTGRPASHGCIRLPGAFAKRVFGLTKCGAARCYLAPGCNAV